MQRKVYLFSFYC